MSNDYDLGIDSVCSLCHYDWSKHVTLDQYEALRLHVKELETEKVDLLIKVNGQLLQGLGKVIKLQTENKRLRMAIGDTIDLVEHAAGKERYAVELSILRPLSLEALEDSDTESQIAAQETEHAAGWHTEDSDDEL